MSQPLGPSDDLRLQAQEPVARVKTLRVAKKKGCKKSKCSKWKGGQCRCGRD
ncbi:hypothetical protein IFHNHDMJ_01379 [Synechococcus sp. CBW1107]|nr:hypothetical protein IFHNHDMJ_01379 [Synechococcus sp. CBW1107]